jgi:hypothetical protein
MLHFFLHTYITYMVEVHTMYSAVWQCMWQSQSLP